MRETLEVAFELLADQGLPGLTVHELARRLGQSVGALYRYFPSKEALLAEMQRQVISRLRAVIREQLVDLEDGGDPAQGIRNAATAFVAFVQEQPAHFHLLSGVLADPRHLLQETPAQQVGEALGELLTDIDRALDSAVRVGHLAAGSSRERTLVLWAGLQGLVQLQKLARLEPGLADLNGLAHGLVDTLLRGWAPSHSKEP